MSYEGYIAVISLVLSIIIGIGGLRKGKADTFVSYQEALAKAQARSEDQGEQLDRLEIKYTEMQKKYDELQNKYEELARQYKVMEDWNRMLVNQLKEAGISPITLTQAKKLNGS